jgi:hypothetical protein
MYLAQAYQFLNDFKISKAEFGDRDKIKRIIKLINLKQKSKVNAVSNLDLQGFIDFNLQLGYLMY